MASQRWRRATRIVLTVGSVFTFLSGAQAQTFTWRGNSSSGFWSDSSNWLGSTPTAPGGSGVTLLFDTFSSLNSINNLGTYTLNALVFNVFGSSSASSPRTLSGNPLNFVANGGTSPRIEMNDSGFLTVSCSLILGSSLNITGVGRGRMTLSGQISGANGLQVDHQGTFGQGLIVLSGNNTFTGGVTLRSGNLEVGHNNALGTGLLTIEAGTGTHSLAFRTTDITISNAIQLNADLNLTSNSEYSFLSGYEGGTLAGTLTGSGGLQINKAPITLSGVGNYTGATILRNDNETVPFAPRGGSLILSGGGILNATSAIQVEKGAILSLVNSPASNLMDRIADAIPVFLSGGQLSFTGAAGLASSETISSLSLDGSSLLSLAAQSAANSTSVLTIGALTRINNATLFVRTTTSTQSVGGGAPGPNRTNVLVTGGLPTRADPLGPTGGQNTGIVPFLTGSLLANGDPDFPTTLATYNPVTGIQLFDTTDPTFFNILNTPLSVFTPHVNTVLQGNVVHVTPITGTLRLNSLLFTPAGFDYNVTLRGSTGTGSDTLSVYSGALLTWTPRGANGITFRDLRLDFGNTTGYLSGGTYRVEGNASITGSGGLVVGNSFLRLNNAANSFTGGLFINTLGNVIFTSDAQLGATGEALVLNGGVLTGSGMATVASTRPVQFAASGAILSADTGEGILNIAGTISGSGGLFIAPIGNIFQSRGIVELSGNIGYTGDTVLNGGTLRLTGTNTGTGSIRVGTSSLLEFTNSTNLPSGPLVLEGGFLRLLGSGTASNSIILSPPSDVFVKTSTVIVNQGIQSVFSGDITGRGNLSKLGQGDLILTGSTFLDGNMFLSEGSLIVRDAGTIQLSSDISVSSGAKLHLDNSAGALDRIRDNTDVILGGGEFVLQGTPGVGVFESIARVVAGTGSGIVTLLPGAGGSVTLETATGSDLLYRGANLGAASGDYSRILFQSTSGIIGGIIPGAAADSSPTGNGVSLALYDATLGVRPGQSGDYVTGATLQNAVPTNTPMTANFRVTGLTTAPGSNRVNSLTLASGSQINSGGTLTLTSGTVFVEAGVGQSRISGGTLTNGTGANLNFYTVGDLLVESVLSANASRPDVKKMGPGVLTLSGANTFTGSLLHNGGTIRLDANNTLNSAADIVMSGNARLETGSFQNTITDLTGGSLSTIALSDTGIPGTSALTIIGSSTVNSTFNGTIEGTGSLSFAPTAPRTLTLGGANTFTGGVRGNANAAFRISSPTGFGTGPVTLANTFSGTVINFAVGTAAIQNDITLSTVGGITSVFVASSTTSPFPVTVINGDVTLAGRIRGGSTAANTVLEFSSNTFHLTNPNNDFTATVRIDGGSLDITSNSVLGNPANRLEIQGSSVIAPLQRRGLRFDAADIVIPRPVHIPSVPGQPGEGVINTNGFRGELSGELSGAANTTFGKHGAGTIILSAPTSPFLGQTVVSEGTLLVNGVLGAAASTGRVTVRPGATLGGTGTIRGGAATVAAIVLETDAILAPGDSGAGILTAPSLTWTPGGFFDFTLSSAAQDRLDLITFFNKGTVGAVPGAFFFRFTDTENLTPGTYTLVNFGSTNFQPGDHVYTGLPDGLIGAFVYNTTSLQFVVNGVVPEPSTILLWIVGGGLGAFTLVSQRRKGIPPHS